MQRVTFVVSSTIVILGSLALGFAPAGASVRPAADEPVGDSQSVPSAADTPASGAEDTLKACITRIPKDATIGQRMIAVESCERDESDRKAIQAVPGDDYAAQQAAFTMGS